MGFGLDRRDRRMLTLAVQALGSLAVEPLYVLTDTAIVGRIGTAELGGLALAATVLSFVVSGCNFLAYGTTERIARRRGAGDEVAAANVGVQSLWLAAGVSAVLLPLLVGIAPLLAGILGGSGEVHDTAVTYLRIAALGVPFILITLAAQGVHRGAADFKTPLLILLAANAANVVIEIVFVFGFDWGIAGSAWSTVIAQAGAATAFLARSRHMLRPMTERRPDWVQMAPLLSAGRHLLLRTMSMLAVIAGSTAVAARVDEPTLAAHQLGITMFTFLALSLDAFAVPTQTLVADELGRGGRDAAFDVALRAQRLSLVAAAGVALLLAALATNLAGVFTGDQDVIDRAIPVFLWLAVIMLPGAVAFAHDGVLIGAADYRFLGVVSVCYFFAVAPLGVVVLLTPDVGVHGIWAGLALWMALRAAVNHRRTTHLLGPRAGFHDRPQEQLTS